MVEVEIYKRRSVEYNALKREFQVWENNKKMLVAPTQLEIEDLIDKTIKSCLRGRKRHRWHRHPSGEKVTTSMKKLSNDKCYWCRTFRFEAVIKAFNHKERGKT